MTSGCAFCPACGRETPERLTWEEWATEGVLDKPPLIYWRGVRVAIGGRAAVILAALIRNHGALSMGGAALLAAKAWDTDGKSVVGVVVWRLRKAVAQVTGSAWAIPRGGAGDCQYRLVRVTSPGEAPS